jgi:hypothetical protein
MCEIMEKIANEERMEERKESIKEGKLQNLFDLVKDSILIVSEAAKRANMTEIIFLENMKKFKA